MNYLTLEELEIRESDKLPRLADGEIDVPRCQAAIEDASDFIRAYLPSLVDENGIHLVPPERIAGTLRVICCDIVMYRLDERSGEEHVTARYEKAIALLEALAGGGSSQTGSYNNHSSGSGGIEPVDDDSSAIIEGYSEFLPPKGKAH